VARTVYENQLYRLVEHSRPVKGELTPEMIAHVEAVLLGKAERDSTLRVPAELLEQLGVASTADLELSFEEGRLVLTPKAARSRPPAEGDATTRTG